ncbi:hypothetical protein ACOSQ3_015774 [Xanthoceras sorbifolium]
MNIVGCKWVFRTKYNPNGTLLKHKARLVAKGFHQTPGLDFEETFSPIMKAATIRVLFSIVVQQGWDIKQVDINNAFLNGDLNEVVYMRQPESFENTAQPSHVCRLHKALYRLKQAPRSWFHKLQAALLSWGFVNSASDVSLFIHREGAKVIFLLVYVDDILLTGTDSYQIQQLISKLNATFALKNLGSVSYFLGFETHRDVSGLFLTQTKYICDLLQKTNMLDCKPYDTPLSARTKLTLTAGAAFSDPTMYRSVIGALQYLSHTRPDISFVVNKLSQYLVSPTQVHWLACKRVLRYLKGSITRGLWFKKCAAALNIEAYTDADWESCFDDRRSTSGNCLFLGGNLICWSSKKQHVVARSSTEAEYRSMSQVITDIIWLKSLLAELGFSSPSPAVVWCNNMGANALALNPVYHSRTKHVEIDVHFIRENVASKEIEPRYVPTEFQIADILTKGLTTIRFQLLCTKLNLVDSPSLSLKGNVKVCDHEDH